jgi:hypothetical protein
MCVSRDAGFHSTHPGYKDPASTEKNNNERETLQDEDNKNARREAMRKKNFPDTIKARYC